MDTKTIVFVHGMFENPRCWKNWIVFFEARGCKCVAPAWPLHEGDPDYLRENIPTGLGELGLQEVVRSVRSVVSSQRERPIVIGHSVGGLIVQLLANQNIIEAGVCISSIAPDAIVSFDWRYFKNTSMIVNSFKGNEPFMIDKDIFHNSFANTMNKNDSDEAYFTYAIHDSRNILRDCMGRAGRVDLSMPHAPLLFIAGENDEIAPLSLNEKNVKAYKDKTSITEYMVFPDRSHCICVQPGWMEVACSTFEWIERQCSTL